MRIFKENNALTPFQAAVKRGELIDMQVKPYAEFNRFLKVSCGLWMTTAAFDGFVTIPHEKGYRRVQKAARWATVLADLHNVPREDNPKELVYDVFIFRLSGFSQYRPIKVVLVDTDKDEGLLFLLPEEMPPLAVGQENADRA